MSEEKSKQVPKYRITCTEEQARFMAQALEQYSRMICGQITTPYNSALEHAIHKEYYVKNNNEKFGEYMKAKNIVNQQLEVIKKLIWDQLPNQSNGIGYDDKADQMYEMYKVILAQFEKERKQECIKKGEEYHGNVHTGGPRVYNVDRTLMKIEEIDPRERKLKRILDE